jgi:iron complex outermembrane receptor protein
MMGAVAGDGEGAMHASTTASGFLVAALLWGTAAAAQTSDAGASAKRHYEEGTKAFNLGEFPRAVKEYRAAYNLRPHPALLYNIAQSYRLAGDPAQAVFFYRSYLRNVPDAANRREVQERIAVLQAQIAEQKASTAPPHPAELAPPAAATATTKPVEASPAPPSLAVAAPASAAAPSDRAERAPIYKKWWL